MSFRVDEFFDPFDLQDPLSVGDDGGDDDRFTVQFNPE